MSAWFSDPVLDPMVDNICKARHYTYICIPSPHGGCHSVSSSQTAESIVVMATRDHIRNIHSPPTLALCHSIHATVTNRTTQPSPIYAHSPPPSTSPPRRRLLSSKLSLHLPPRLENHLVPPLLQQRLPLVAVRAPRLPRPLATTRLRPATARRVAVNLVPEVIPRDQIRVTRSRRSRLGLLRGTAGVAARRRRRLEGNRRLHGTKLISS